MPTTEKIDYPTELKRIAQSAMKSGNPGNVISATDAVILREAAALIVRQKESIAETKARIDAILSSVPL